MVSTTVAVVEIGPVSSPVTRFAWFITEYLKSSRKRVADYRRKDCQETTGGKIVKKQPVLPEISALGSLDEDWVTAWATDWPTSAHCQCPLVEMPTRTGVASTRGSFDHRSAMATSMGQNAHKSPTASTAREAMRGQRVVRRTIMVLKNRKN